MGMQLSFDPILDVGPYGYDMATISIKVAYIPLYIHICIVYIPSAQRGCDLL